jgi:starch synthase (maltosyl-transferring)
MPAKEEYVDNEKYEIKYWPSIEETRIWKTIKKINNIRKNFFALQTTNNIRFLNTSNDQIMAFLKSDIINNRYLIVIINMDSNNRQSAWVNIPPEVLQQYTLPLSVSDQLNNEDYTWTQDWNYVELDPYHKPAHVFLINNAISKEEHLK